MKTKYIFSGAVTALILLNCTRIDDHAQASTKELRQSIENNISVIKTAVSSITNSWSYRILTTKSHIRAKVLNPSEFRDSITLKLVSGIYNYNLDTTGLQDNFDIPYRLFVRSGISDSMIINLPGILIPKPVSPFDSIIRNDFTITATDYHMYFNSNDSLNYKVTADLTQNLTRLGSLNISDISRSVSRKAKLAEFSFDNEYSISSESHSYESDSGEPNSSSFTLFRSGVQEMREMIQYRGTDYWNQERRLVLILGNLEFRQEFWNSYIEIYQDGAHLNTTAVLLENQEFYGTIFGNTDILITFNDGTTAKLSSLIGPTLSQLEILFESLQNMSFAQSIIDYIASNVYMYSLK